MYTDSTFSIFPETLQQKRICRFLVISGVTRKAWSGWMTSIGIVSARIEAEIVQQCDFSRYLAKERNDVSLLFDFLFRTRYSGHFTCQQYTEWERDDKAHLSKCDFLVGVLLWSFPLRPSEKLPVIPLHRDKLVLDDGDLTLIIFLYWTWGRRSLVTALESFFDFEAKSFQDFFLKVKSQLG